MRRRRGRRAPGRVSVTPAQPPRVGGSRRERCPRRRLERGCEPNCLWRSFLRRRARPDPDELASIGIEEAWSGIGVCLIEWADQAGDWLPIERLAIHLQHLSETKRVLRFVPHGARYQTLLAEFKKSAVA